MHINPNVGCSLKESERHQAKLMNRIPVITATETRHHKSGKQNQGHRTTTAKDLTTNRNIRQFCTCRGGNVTASEQTYVGTKRRKRRGYFLKNENIGNQQR